MAETTETKAKWYAQSVDKVAKQLGVNPAKGLSAAEVKQRQEKYGPNKLAGKKEGTRLAGLPAPV